MMLVLSLGMVISFSSCSSDGDGDGGNGGNGGGNNGLLGTWVLTGVNAEGTYIEAPGVMAYTFQTGGKGVITGKDKNGNDASGYFAWKVVDGILYIKDCKSEADVKDFDEKQHGVEGCKYTISGKKLQLIYDYDLAESQQDIMYFEKK